MKELTTEEKAKRYDDLLVKLQEAKVDNDVCDERYCCVIDNIVPELKESEDEKVRKELLLDIPKVFSYDKAFRYIAYLEKQGEQKYTAEEVLIKAGLKPYKDGDQWCVLLGDNIQEGICGFGNTIEDALYAFLKDLIASQSEQKPSDKVESKFREGDSIQFKGFGHNRYTIKEVCGLSHYINTMGNRMDMSYTDANFELVEQKPAWSEEDEYCINQLIVFCENCMIPDSGAKRCANWLKSLKDRYAWKPSSEQMEALEHFIVCHNGSTNYAKDLEELRLQLKKLRKE